MESNSGDIRPVPDPTTLTNEASARLEVTLRNLIKVEIEHLGILLTEKLNGISIQFETQFTMLNARTAEQKKDTKDALDAALAAAKEAVANQSTSSEKSITKSETATIERIKAVETLLSASTRATDDKIDDIKSRVVAIEAIKLGNTEQVSIMHASGANTRGNMSAIISVVTALIAIISIIITIFVVTKH